MTPAAGSGYSRFMKPTLAPSLSSPVFLLDSPATPKILSEIQPTTAEWIGLRIVHEESESLFVRDGKPESESFASSTGAMVEVRVKGHHSYAATADLSIEGLKRAAKEATRMAVATAERAAHAFNAEARPAARGTYQSPVLRKESLGQVAGEALQTLLACSKALQATDRISRTTAGFVLTRTETRLVSSSGTDIRQSLTQSTPHLLATARVGSEVQTRTNHGHSAQSQQRGLEALFSPTLLESAHQIAKEALELIDAPECPKTRTHLLLAPDQMMLQIHESIGHPLELDRILGDERNYAGSSFVKLSDFGSLQYGSPIMNVTFDPTVTEEFASYAFDDTGRPATREHLIRNGRLERGLGGTESQLRAGVPGTANMRACSWNRPPIDRMANLNLEPGTDSLETLISKVENGIYMLSNRSWSIDDYRNKFQFGCEYAREIKDGRLGRVLKNPNYRGITVPFWNSLIAVGNADTLGTFGTPYCGKGEPNQAISVGHRSPACLFAGIEVFGGEE